MKTVLLVEDELALGDTLRVSIEKIGLGCRWVKTLAEAARRLEEEDYSLMILDRNLPDGDGISLLLHPKRAGKRVLILSSKASLNDRVTGLNRGADDYLPKPFSFKELEARIQALLRREPQQEVPITAQGALWTLDESRLQVRGPAGPVELTPLEFKFLRYLFERKETIISKDRLLREVWGFSFLPKTRTVDYLIAQLRKRIEVDPENPRHLLTIRGAGVKFVP